MSHSPTSEVARGWSRLAGRGLVFPLFVLCAWCAPAVGDEPSPPVDYARIAPLFTKYCAGCHNAADPEAGLALDSFASLMKGGKRGAVITPTRGDQSRLVRVLSGQAKPKMPPDDNPQPTAAEIALIRAWIDAGAKGPEGHQDPSELRTPEIKPTVAARDAINAVAVSTRGIVAVARYQRVVLTDLAGAGERVIAPIRGAVNAVTFSTDGNLLVSGAGEAGLAGEAVLWNVSDLARVRDFRGHRDSIYSVAISPDGRVLATGGYDRAIILWNVETGEQIRVIDGHNGPVFDLAFHPKGHVLASASGDRTVKLWNVATGERLDTLNQSLKELYTVAFAPDGSRVAAGGVDNRIRVWQVSETAKEGTNPLLYSVFGHDAPILRICYAADGRMLVSSGEDRTLKVWQAATMTLASKLENQADWAPALSVAPDNRTVIVGRLDGQVVRYSVDAGAGAVFRETASMPDTARSVDYGPPPAADQIPRIAEREPNDAPAQAQTLMIPAIASGRIADEPPMDGQDVDLFRFAAKAGEQWILETNAAQANSALDSKLELLDASGQPVPRVLLRAVRDSEVTFRGINSDQLECRLVNWEEMELNELLYLNGEVVKLHRKPRGPDSGYSFFPGLGRRIGFFDTSARSHALSEPCYIVVPYPAGTVLPDNGLPTFTLFYENDDDAQRKLGKDSKVLFVAPADGEYLVRVSDVRNFQGESFQYDLIVRRPVPDFKVTLSAVASVAAGSGQEFTLSAERLDGFNGPIQVEFSGLPPGHLIAPITIEPGQWEARGVLTALPEAPATTEASWASVRATATAQIAQKAVSHEAVGLGSPKLTSKPKIIVHLRPTGSVDTAQPAVAANARPWTILAPDSARAKSGVPLTRLADHSILAGGDNPDSDAYTVVCFTDARNIRALRLEALGHPSLPARAPGREPVHGNFVLSELRVSAVPVDPARKPLELKLASAAADHAQGGFDARGVLDSDPKTGWAVGSNDAANQFPVARRGDDASHELTVELAEPLDVAGGVLLVVQLDHASELKKHNLGRFRLSATTQEQVPSQLAAPQIQEVVITPGQMTTCQLRVERFAFGDRIQFDVNNLPHGVIVEDIGLNGVLIPEGKTERTLYLRAESWVGETTRLFHAVANVEGRQVSFPMRLRVARPQVADAGGK